jgi:hypothetical protein
VEPKRGKRWLAAAAAVLPAFLTGCALFRHSDREIAKQQLGVQFYSDLGPEAIDVSGYPPEQQRNYQVYARACSQCHGLARSINSPVVSREFWEMYAQAMRSRSYYTPGQPLSTDETAAIVAFLDYDSKERKIGHKEEFERQSQELKRRFNALIDERARKFVP